jgi:uncharacterized protein
VEEARGDAGLSVLDRLRHPSADDAAGGAPSAGGFEQLDGHKYCLLVSYRRDGTPIATPLWFGTAGGKVYSRTAADDWKVKRIRNNPRVLIGPCTFRGKPRGPLAEGRARVLPPEEEPVAEAAIQSNYGFGRRAYKAGIDRASAGSVYLEIAPGGEGA